MPKMYREGDRPLPNYELLAFLGEGGFGEVWKAVNESKIEVALKILNLQGKQSVREVFAIRQLRNVRHPNLIPIHGFWLKDEAGNILQNAASESMSGFMLDGDFQFFVSMGLGDKTLMDRLNECRKEGQDGIPLDELMQYMDEAGRALDFLNTPRHDMGSREKVSIEHCDIKPQNILLVGGSVQICDFGLARVQQQGLKQNQTGNFSHHYVAPEMLKKELGPGRTTDQYSLAISYVQLRTGRLPFGDINFPPAVLTAHLEGKLDLSMLPVNEQKILKRATQLKPEDRFPTARAFTDALREMAITLSRPTKAPVGIKGPIRAGTEVVPGYRLEELIGRGSFGEVWRATAPGRMKKAIKIIRNLELASSRQELRSLDLITEVRHPYLIQIEACFLLDKEGDLIPDEAREAKEAPRAETLVIVSELAESHLGKRLQDCLSNTGHGLPPKELLSYMRHVAVALDRLNNQHEIIHRDVKPENILLVGGIAKLADFGLAKALEGSSAMIHTKSIGMTPAYAAPELCNGRIEKATDQYSLALTYYHLRTGQLATGEVGDLSELIRSHLSNRLDFSLVSPLESQVLKRATALQSSQRFPTCVNFVKALMASFSRSDLPRETAYSTAESIEEMPSLDSSSLDSSISATSVTWADDSSAPVAPVVIRARKKVGSGETIKKLTDTTTEDVAKAGQKSTRKEVSLSKTHPRRRRSNMARLVVTVLILCVVGAVITGIIMLAPPGSKESASKETVRTSPTNPVQTIGTPPSLPQATSPTKPTETAKKTKSTSPAEPVRRTATELLSSAKEALLAKKPAQAAGEMLELAKRYQSGEAPYDPVSLLQAAECYEQLVDDEKTRKDIVAAFSGYANQFFLDQGASLRDDKQDMDWALGKKLQPLADADKIWVQVFEIEKLLHQDKLNPGEDVVLQAKAARLATEAAGTEWGGYDRYLRGAIAWRLKNPAEAVKLFVELDKKQSQFRWTSARQNEIITIVQNGLLEKKQSAFRLAAWREPVVSLDDAVSFARMSTQLESWTGAAPSEEDRLLFALSASQGTLSREQARGLLDEWKTKKLDQSATASSPLLLAFTYRQFQLMKAGKENPEEMLPVAYRLITGLQSQPALQPKGEENVKLFDSLIDELGSLTRLETLSPEGRQQLALLYSSRARLVLENLLFPWAANPTRLNMAHDDLDKAITMTKAILTPDRVGNTIWLAFAKRELKRADWQPLISHVNAYAVTNTPKHVLLLLQGYLCLERDRDERTQSKRQELVTKAQGHFKNVIDGTAKQPSDVYWLNLARLGASQAHLEYANYLEMSDDESVRNECRQHLKLAESHAKEVAEDKRVHQLKPEAEMAWGNATEDFGLLLEENRYGEAIDHFKQAIDSWKGSSKRAQALIHRARAMIRSEDSTFKMQIDRDLDEALSLKPEGDIASELHYWKADQLRRAQQFAEARTELEQAANVAKTPAFRDNARCALLELVMALPVNRDASKAMKQRADDIVRQLPKISEIDPQLRKRAELLQLYAWNELCNLYFVLQKQAEDKESSSKLFMQYLKNLESSTELLAQWHAAKHRGKWLISQGKSVDAWKVMNLDGQFEKRLSELEVMPPKRQALVKQAFLDLAVLRFDTLVNLSKSLRSQLLANIKVIDRLRKFSEHDPSRAVTFTGFAGIIRGAVHELCKEEVSEKDLEKYKSETIVLLKEALRQSPEHVQAWRWALALSQFDDPKQSDSYLMMAIKAVRNLPETEMDPKVKTEVINNLEQRLNK